MTDTTRAEARQVAPQPKPDDPAKPVTSALAYQSMVVVLSFAAGVLAANYAIEWRDYRTRNEPKPVQAWEPTVEAPEPVKPQFSHDRFCGRIS
jgi:hypothetical protein